VETLVSVRKVLLYPDPRLKEVSETVGDAEWDDELLALACDLRDTMLAYKGVGLAAPQIGVMRRVLAVTNPGERETLVMANPVIKRFGRDRKKMREGCLSFPGVFEWVERSLKVEVEYSVALPYGLHGGPQRVLKRFRGLQAHVIQHELEHLDGILLNSHHKSVV
jgi:peptide deformylase